MSNSSFGRVANTVVRDSALHLRRRVVRGCWVSHQQVSASHPTAKESMADRLDDNLTPAAGEGDGAGRRGVALCVLLGVACRARRLMSQRVVVGRRVEDGDHTYHYMV